MNKKSQSNIWGTISFSAVFIVSWLILGVMEISSGLISEIINIMLVNGAGVENAGFFIRLIVPVFFIASMIIFILWLKGNSNEI